MKYTLSALLTLTAPMAQAHVGHLNEAAGHGHWLGAAAIAAAIALGLWAGLTGRKEAEEAAPEGGASDEETAQEA